MLASLRTGTDRVSIGSQSHERGGRDLESNRRSNAHDTTTHKPPGTGRPKKKYMNYRSNTSAQEIEIIREAQKGQNEILTVLSEQIKTLTSLVNNSLNVEPVAPNTISEPNGNTGASRYDNFPLPDPSAYPTTNNRTNFPISTGPGHTSGFGRRLHRIHRIIIYARLDTTTY